MDFINFLTPYRNNAFKWGKRDCCLFVADWLKTIKDVDFAADLRGKYKTEQGAKRALKKLGFNGIQDIANTRLGESVGALVLNNGDIALVKNHVNEDTLGIVWHTHVWVLGLNGVEALPADLIIKGWRVDTCHQ